jgi:hypothetical protein
MMEAVGTSEMLVNFYGIIFQKAVIFILTAVRI